MARNDYLNGLPNVLSQAQSDPYGWQQLLAMGGYDLYGQQMEEQKFSNASNILNLQNENSSKLQQNSFDFQNTQMSNAFGRNLLSNTMNQNNALELQANQFSQAAKMQQSGAEISKGLQAGNIAGNIMNAATFGVSNLVGQGVGLLGGYLNYTYSSKLQQQAFQNQEDLYKLNVNTMSDVFEKDGLPASAAFMGSNMLGALPRSTQVLSGANTRTAMLPGTQNALAGQSDVQNALGLGVVNVQ